LTEAHLSTLQTPPNNAMCKQGLVLRMLGLSIDDKVHQHQHQHACLCKEYPVQWKVERVHTWRSLEPRHISLGFGPE